jgi:hypothetical protein
MYFVMFIICLALIIAPVLGGSQVPVGTLKDNFKSNTMISDLFQPNNRTSAYYNDTGPQNTDILASDSSARARLTETGTATAVASASAAARRLVKLL